MYINENVGNGQCSETQIKVCIMLVGEENKEAGLTPTRLDDDRHGGLLNDGSYSGESGEAAVVSPAVLLLRMREVKVSI